MSRRRRVLLSLALVVVLIAGAAVGAARWGRQSAHSGNAKITAGLNADQWGYQAFSEPSGWHQTAEAALGHPFEAASVYIGMLAPGSFPSEGAHILSVGGTMYLHISAQTTDALGNKVGIDYADIRAGLYDSYLDQWATNIVALGIAPSRLVITWQHEPTANSPQQPKVGDWSGPAYIATYAYVRARLIAGGVVARWGYFPTVSSYATGKAADYYPGDALVDVIGADAYMRTSANAFYNKIGKFLNFATAHGKLAAVGELGDDQTDGTRPAWITDVAGYLLGKVVFLNWNAKPDFGLVPGSPEWDAWLAASAAWYV